MRRLRLRKAAIRFLLGRVDQVGELDGVLDEEHRDVVADDVPVAFLGVELHGEAAHVARDVGRALVAGDGREADKGGCPLAGALEDVGAGHVREGFIGLEEAVGAEPARVHHALGNPLVVEVKDLFAEMLVLEQRRSAGTLAQRILVVGNGHSGLGGQHRHVAPGDLMCLPALAPQYLCVGHRGGASFHRARGNGHYLSPAELLTVLSTNSESTSRFGIGRKINSIVGPVTRSHAGAMLFFRAGRRAEWHWLCLFTGMG